MSLPALPWSIHEEVLGSGYTGFSLEGKWECCYLGSSAEILVRLRGARKEECLMPSCLGLHYGCIAPLYLHVNTHPLPVVWDWAGPAGDLDV